MKIIAVDNNITNSDWTKANSFDFPDLKTVKDFEQQFNIPSDEPARSEKLARLARLPWVRVAPAPVRELLQGFKKQSLVDVIKASFGGDRSEAGRYAANIRWQGHRKGDKDKKPPSESLKEQIDRTATLLEALRGKKSYNLPEAKTYSKTTALFYSVKRGSKSFWVPSLQVMEAEAAVNALGKRVLDEVGAKLVESGFCTQQELDNLIANQNRRSFKNENKNIWELAVDGDQRIYPLVSEEVENYKKMKNEAKIAKGLLIKATKQYNEIRAKEGWGENARQAYESRMRLRDENEKAKERLNRAQSTLISQVSRSLSKEEWKDLKDELKGSSSYPSSPSSEERSKYLLIAKKIGEEVQGIIGEHRPMASKFPATLEAMPYDQRKNAERIMEETARRFPSSLLNRLQGVKIKQGWGGGSWRESELTIRTDFKDADTPTHETVHAITHFSEASRLMEKAALARRTWGVSGDLTTPMDVKIKQGRQRQMGNYIADDFASDYQGRIYDIGGYTETLTVATENLFGGGNHFRFTLKADRDMMATALGLLLTAEKRDD